MSRVAIYQALSNSVDLNDLGINADTIFPNYSMDGAPTKTSPFVILRWQENPFLMAGDPDNGTKARGVRILTVWAHYPKNLSTDYSYIDAILSKINDVLVVMKQVSGDDGYIVTCVKATGEGSDLTDPAYNTIMRNSAFEVLFRAA